MLLRSRSRTPHRGHREEREDQETPRYTVVKEDGRRGHPERREKAGAAWEGEAPKEPKEAAVGCLGVGTRGEGSGHRIGTGTLGMGRVQGHIVG